MPAGTNLEAIWDQNRCQDQFRCMTTLDDAHTSLEKITKCNKTVMVYFIMKYDAYIHHCMQILNSIISLTQ